MFPAIIKPSIVLHPVIEGYDTTIGLWDSQRNRNSNNQTNVSSVICIEKLHLDKIYDVGALLLVSVTSNVVTSDALSVLGELVGLCSSSQPGDYHYGGRYNQNEGGVIYCIKKNISEGIFFTKLTFDLYVVNLKPDPLNKLNDITFNLHDAFRDYFADEESRKQKIKERLVDPVLEI